MNKSIGFLAIAFGIATIAIMPLLELVPATGASITLARGIPGAALLGIIFLLNRQLVGLPNKNTLLISMYFALATYFLFEGLKSWGASYTIVLLDMAVLVPLIFKVVRNEPIKKGHVVAFVVAIVGASLALRVWNTDDLRIDGLMYSLAALVANGMFIEVSSRSSGDAQNLHTKVFWQSVGLVIIGMFLGGAAPIQMSSHQWALLAGVALLSGLVNFYLFFIAVKHIGGVLAGMLALSITPLTIIVSYIFLGKTMGLDQIVGVAIGLSAVGYIARTGSR